MIVDIQLNPATTPWPVLRDGVLAAEMLGYGAAWVFDHFDGRLLGGSGMLDCFTLLGALATSTTTIGLGSLVANVVNRPAPTLAAAAASIQAISGGRLILGLGAGSSPGTRFAEEHAALGVTLAKTMAERHRAVADQLDVLDTLWDRDRSEVFAGFALPDPRPPVIVGVNSVALAEAAGRRCDGVNVRAVHPRAEEFLAAAVAAAGDRPFMTTAWVSADDEATISKARGWELDRLITVHFRRIEASAIPPPA